MILLNEKYMTCTQNWKFSSKLSYIESVGGGSGGGTTAGALKPDQSSSII